MTAQESTSQPAVVPKSVLLPLSVFAVLLALIFFGIAAVFQSRGLTDDTLAAVAAALIGGIFLIAGVAGIQSTRRKIDAEAKKTASRIPNGVIRVIALLLGSIAVLGGIEFLCMSFIVMNQEYLHYFEFSRSYHSGTGSHAGLLAEFAIMGFALAGIGLFLLWYAAHPVSRLTVLLQRLVNCRRQTATADSLSSDRNCKPDESS